MGVDSQSVESATLSKLSLFMLEVSARCGRLTAYRVQIDDELSFERVTWR